MAHTDTAVDQPSKGDQSNGPVGRKKRSSEWRRLAKIVYRDPEHVAERLTLFGSKHLSEPSREWAETVREERPDAPLPAVAEEVRIQTAQVARIDGAISGTPFLIALVPGYLAYLWQEGRMEQRIAALYGHDPRELETAAEILVLRGVHPTVKAAREALLKVRDTDLPDKPTARRPVRVWVRSIYVLLVFGGFLSGGSGEERDKYAHWRLKAALGLIGATVIWVITWVLPLTFMIAMAWACESHARSLGRRTMSFYGGESTDNIDAAIAAAAEEEDQGRSKRELLRGLLLVVSVAIPLAFVVYANYVRQTTGLTLASALGAVVAAALVIALSLVASRR
jgi:hypothetical protein